MKSLDLSELTGTASRTYVTRAVTKEMVSRPVHVAIALWDVPFKSAKAGKLHGWIIGINDGSSKTFIRTGQTKAETPVPEVKKALLACLRGRKGEKWVVTGRRQAALRKALEDKGFTVTGSFSHQNRAVVRVSKLRGIEERKALRASRKAGEAPRTKTVTTGPVIHALWWPNVKAFDNAASTAGTLRIATDASSDTRSKGAMCFVASNGDYQLRSMPSRASTNELELETITLALKYAARTKVKRVIIQTDSQGALEAVKHIQRNGHRGRKWRGLAPGALSRFQQAWLDLKDQCRVDIRRVMGHAGDPLNEAADRIAYMGLRATAHPEKAARPTLLEGIEKVLPF